MKENYDNGLNLPKTDFRMKADLSKNELEILKFWKSKNIYKKIVDKNSGRPCYVLHDGPPYANGNIHLGHALNKVLKDIIIKFKNMSGFFAPFVPGWDTHGLPTELKALDKMNCSRTKNISDIDLREKCKETASEYLDIQREEFKRLGVFGDWDNPYVTFEHEFESNQIRIFAKMVESGAIYRGLKPVNWCCSCRTALAEAEIEYKNDECESVYVKFKLDFKNCGTGNLFVKKVKELNINIENIYSLIWTTTIWTLPANVAICLNADFDYSLVEFNKEYYIIASKLAEGCFSSGFRILLTLRGSKFEDLIFFHPFLKKKSRLILGNHVTLNCGTGCVHTAPGHGLEDFEICSKYGIETVVPLDDSGFFTEEANFLKGLFIEEASEKIKENLKNNNNLFLVKKIKHKYPHCWRCKKPTVFRATKQWFCSIEKFKSKIVESIEKVEWIPRWGKERITSMVKERSDWCVSRQRRWGVPIPVFFCNNCGWVLINYSIILKISEIFKKHGSDCWYCNPAEFFLSGEKCENCGCGTFEKELDIMDVWFDSGTTYSVLGSNCFPADLYLEGSDQHRGWFQSSLITSVITTGKPPYKGVLTHGWVLDDEGQKQSKSLGNVISPQSVIEKFGADILRLWVSSVDYKDDVKISNNIINQIVEFYRKFRNTIRFMLANLYDFRKDDCLSIDSLCSIDKWALFKLNELMSKCIEAYKNYEFYTIYHLVQKFCVANLSNFYFDIIKDRLYVESKDGHFRKSAQTVIYFILVSLTKLVAPILSFTCEEIWRYIPDIEEESIFLSDFESKFDLDVPVELVEVWDRIIKISDSVKKELETARKDKIIGSSLEACIEFYSSSENYEFLNSNSEKIKDALIVSKVGFFKDESSDGIKVKVKKSLDQKCMRCWIYNESVGKNKKFPSLCDRCAKILGE
ncbi:MAG: isoleucine--tRNA ligase [Candidatus Improbicoccus pseudotrichonymphae]|uniref:Isoleucine--tRNA ligase n=1 Tax=Candidatus Improbicoccus pseudotrichonymphae TaxID=3033792 RepID=A0AA48HYI8_9FIRM|nr:MAG: isoleucine--tRNA ligase [Candidatus Improbicoccus pseudotrichonymphae]